LIEPNQIEQETEQSTALLKCKDYLVSNKEFEIRKSSTGILKTYPVPKDLHTYYESTNYISHTDAASSSQDKLYQYIKSRMLRKKAGWIEKESAGCKLLDYGAGTGDFTEFMKARNWDASGVEPNLNARAVALEKGIHLSNSLEELDANKKYDVITLWHVLEHIPNYAEVILQLRSLLNKNGLLVIAVPNHRSYDAYYYQEFWAAWDVPRHLWHFSRSGMAKLMEDNQFLPVLEKPLIFDSFYVSLLSEQHKKLKASKINAFWRGLLSNLQAKRTGEYSSITYFYRKS